MKEQKAAWVFHLSFSVTNIKLTTLSSNPLFTDGKIHKLLQAHLPIYY